MAWTDDKIDKLKRLWGKGLTASQIAKKIGSGITRNAVIGKAHRLKLPSRPSPLKAGPKKAVAVPAPAEAEPKPVVVEKSAPEKPQNMTTLLELTEQTCKWPIGHPGDSDFYFCGQPSRPGVPYCPDHCLMAFQAQLPRKDRPASR